MKRLVTGLLLLVSFVFLFADNTVGYLRSNGKVLEETNVSFEEVESYYEWTKSQYGSFDEVFEEPYVKSYLLIAILKDKAVEFFAKQEGLSVEEFQKKYSRLSDEELLRFFNENREDLLKNYEYVVVKYAFFEEAELAKKVFEEAKEIGFEKALEKYGIDLEDAGNLRRAETNETFIEVLFSGEGLKYFETEEGIFLLNVEKIGKISDFDSFVQSPYFDEIMSETTEKVYEENLTKLIEENNIEFDSDKDSYKIWMDIVSKRSAEEIYKEYVNKVVDKNSNILTNDSWLIAGLIETIENIQARTEEQSNLRTNLLRKLYSEGNKTFLVLSRLSEVVEDEKIELEYNVALSNILISYIDNGDIMSVLNYLFQNLNELEGLSNSENIDIKKEALLYLAIMYSKLGEKETALQYLNTLKGIDPNYIDYESFEKELNNSDNPEE